jgi:cytochrome c nitrite reductase small subunit
MIRYLLNLLTLQGIDRKWRPICFVVLGVAAGLGLAVAKVSRAASYLGDEPETCVNCHVMTTSYGTWQRSSHANVATCNDCHVPHDTMINKYAFKARDGMYHSTIFTLRLEPQVIQLSNAAVGVVQGNCMRCHDNVIGQVHIKDYEKGDQNCWDCHREVPHGRSRSLSTTNRMMTPQLQPSTFFKDQPLIGGRSPRRSQEKTK